MKRGIAVFLLSVMVLVAVQPVIAMHYCGEELYSWDFFISNDNSSCCPTNIAEFSHHSASSSENHDCNIGVAHDNCCDFETIQVSTDEYQNKVQESNPAEVSLSIDNVWFTLNYLLRETQPEKKILLPQKDFPPSGLFMQDVSILNFICIYRI